MTRIIQPVYETHVFSNEEGNIVIQQFSERGEEQFIFFPPDKAKDVIEAIKKEAEL